MTKQHVQESLVVLLVLLAASPFVMFLVLVRIAGNSVIGAFFILFVAGCLLLLPYPQGELLVASVSLAAILLIIFCFGIPEQGEHFTH